jgi:5'-methylthioadenosine phosphorylase
MPDEGRIGVMLGSGLAVGDVTGRFGARDEVIVLNRHGPGPFVPAPRIDHAGNLGRLRTSGCDRVVAVGSTGSLRRDWSVGTFVAPDDFFAPWVVPSLFADERGHRVPGFDLSWRRTVVDAWSVANREPLVDGGVYVQTPGPRFETSAEVRFLAGVGDLVGMTLAAECIIAGELGLRYAALCVVDNLANGRADAPLTAEDYRRGAAANRTAMASNLAAVITHLVERG